MAIAKKLFEQVTDVTRDAARIQPDRLLKPEDIRAATQLGLAELFNTE